MKNLRSMFTLLHDEWPCLRWGASCQPSNREGLAATSARGDFVNPKRQTAIVNSIGRVSATDWHAARPSTRGLAQSPLHIQLAPALDLG